LTQLLWQVVVCACTAVVSLPAAAAAATPFVIAPMIEGVGYCAAGASSKTIAEALAICTSDQNPSATLLGAALNRLEPGGAAGDVQIGYTVGINLMGFARPEDLLAHLGRLQALIDSVKRPVVLYLMGNQFAAPPADVSLPHNSYALFSDQSVPKEHYFVDSINAWTLETDTRLNVNECRFSALQQVGHWYQTLAAATKERVVGITLAGELHHFFPDFAKGLGRFDNIRVTDYSPASVNSFQRWLRKQYPEVSDMNRRLGSAFASHETVTAPAKDLRKDKLESFSQHFDAYAHGLLPVEGWIEALNPGEKINVYLNGRMLGEAEYGLSRQDVYEAVPAVRHAGVGFRYWLDFSHTPRGIHTLQVVLAGGGKTRQIARRKIVLMGNNQLEPLPFLGEVKSGKKKPAQRFWLDQPRDMQDYYFNPLAKAWYEFRSYQVTQAYTHWFKTAVSSGMPEDKLYSHQIATAVVGTWNPLLTASDDSLSGKQPYQKGINLYAGALNMQLLRNHYLSDGEPFAVPEFHTQAWKNPQAPAQVLATFRDAGARFMSPYFISLFPATLRHKNNPHDKFRIAPDNPKYGSDQLYRAMAQMARQ